MVHLMTALLFRNVGTCHEGMGYCLFECADGNKPDYPSREIRSGHISECAAAVLSVESRDLMSINSQSKKAGAR